MEPTPVVYTYGKQFQVPERMGGILEDTEKTVVPIVEKLTADGTILAGLPWSRSYTHPRIYARGVWSSNTISGLMKVLDEVRKAGHAGANRGYQARRLLMQTSMYHNGQRNIGVSARGLLGILRLTSRGIHRQRSRSSWCRRLRNRSRRRGYVLRVDEQYVNTSAPRRAVVVITYPMPEGMEKWAAAINATQAKWSAAERAEFVGSTVLDSRRDIMARITHSGHK